MTDEAPFQCLRCGADFPLHYVPKMVEERTCPKCHSNSVRRTKPQKKTAAKKPDAESKAPPPA